MNAGDRAIAYIRVSVVGDRAKRGRFESPSLQREAIDRWAQDNRVEIVDELQDLNRSGGTLTRPGLTTALERIKAGEIKGIVVARSDRASRRALDGLGLIDQLDKLGGWIAACDGSIDTTTRLGRMATTMNFAMAQSELDRYREQSAEVHRRAIVEKGRHMGPTPYGYRRDENGILTPNPDEARVIRLIFQRRADGAGWVRLAGELDKAGVRKAGGRKFNQVHLGRIVRNRVYLGEARHGQHVKVGAHEPLVDEALWAAANRANPAVRSSPRVDRRHEESVLRGLVRCAGCRYVCKRFPSRTPGAFRWECRTRLAERSATHECEAPVIVRSSEYEELERIVVSGFMRIAANRAAKRGGDEEAEADLRALTEAEELLDELSSLEVRRQLGAGRWASMVAEARTVMEAAAARVARNAAGGFQDADISTLRDAWDGWPVQVKQDALGSIIQAVMVVAGDGPLRERVFLVPVWEPVELPVRGSKGWSGVAWNPDSAMLASEGGAEDTV